jgi:hypothetical protein
VTVSGIRLVGHFQLGDDIAEIIGNEVAYCGCVKFLSLGFYFTGYIISTGEYLACPSFRSPSVCFRYLLRTCKSAWPISFWRVWISIPFFKQFRANARRNECNEACSMPVCPARRVRIALNPPYSNRSELSRWMGSSGSSVSFGAFTLWIVFFHPSGST